MKFAWKIFFSTCILLVLSLGIGSFLLVNSSFQAMLNARKAAALEKSISLSLSYQALLAADQLLSTNLALSTNSTDAQTKVSSVNPFPQKLESGQRGTRLLKENDETIIFQVVCALESPSGELLYMESREDFSDIYALRNKSQLMAYSIVGSVCIISGSLAFWYSQWLTRPLKRLSRTAVLLGQGDFSCRTPISSSTPEMFALSCSFNYMAEQVQQHIQQLQDEARKRDDFVANFTHELKTPLTSIIGYADLMRSFELEPSQRREYSDFIYREGSRLETLSLHLMDLIVLNHWEPPCSAISTQSIFEGTRQALLPLMEKENVRLMIHAESAMVLADAHLVQTMLYNLADNARKAMNGTIKEIEIRGTNKGDRYYIMVTDTGCGIDENQIDRITEPFYMVDKSRARSQGGAGLGLALCQRITCLHGSRLHIVSQVGKGTSVSFTLPVSSESTSEKEATI